MKGFFKSILITLLVLISIAGIAIGVCYGCFYDGTVSNNDLKNGVTHDYILENVVVESIDNTKESKLISFKIDEEDINYLLKESRDSLDPLIKQYVQDFYVEVKDEHYDFYLSLSVPMFKTRLAIQTTAIEYIDATNSENNELRFTINDIKVGRIGGLFDFAIGLIGKYLDTSGLDAIFKNAGLNIHVDLANHLLRYKEHDLFNDLKAFLGDQDDLMITLMENFKNQNLIKFNFANYLGLDIDLAGITKTTYDDLLSPALEKQKANLIKLIEEKSITKEDVNDFQFFLLRGYNALSVEQKAKLAGKDLSMIGIDDIENYKGIDVPPADDLGNAIEKNIKNNTLEIATKIALGQDATIAKVTEEDITAYLRSSEVLGMSYVLSNYNVIKEKVNCNYIALSDFYARVENDKMFIEANLNINGLILNLSIELIIISSNANTFTIEVKDAFIGTLKADKQFKDYLFGLIKNSLGKDARLTVDDTKYQFTLNLNNIFKGINLTVAALNKPMDQILSEFNYGAETKFIGPEGENKGALVLNIQKAA